LWDHPLDVRARRRHGYTCPMTASGVQTLTLRRGVLDLRSGLFVTERDELQLTEKELAVLRYLVGRPERTVSRTELLEEIWRSASLASRVTDDTMRRLRAKLESDPRNPQHLLTVHGEGYRFVFDQPDDDALTAEPAARATQTLALESGVVNLQTGVVFSADDEVRLSTRELALLAYLAARPGRVVTRTELLTEVWGYAPNVASRAADDTMRRLRSRVERIPSRPRHLQTVHRTGYRFIPAAPLVRDALDYGAVQIDFDRQLLVWRDGREEVLNPAEAALLSALAAENGGVVSRTELRRSLRRRGARANLRAVDTVLSRLRRRIEPDPSRPRFLINVRGQGYRLVSPPSASSPPEDLPLPRTALIGRVAEKVRLDAMLSRPGVVCITGPGGIGKTTLALQAAHRALGWESISAVFFCDLSSLTDPERLVHAVAPRVQSGLRLGSDPLSALAGALREHGQPLVVLDCVDRLVPDAFEMLTALAARAPSARLLVTSRVAPDCVSSLQLGPLSTDDSVALYAQQAPGAGFEPSAVARIVERLDCVPLAVELAARRSGLLSAEQMLARLDERLDLLGQDAPGAARHSSLRASITWSWELLSDADQEALACCGLFEGAFTAMDFCAIMDDDESAPLLSRLATVSLVVSASPPGGGDVPFHRLLDTVAHFSRERLAASPRRAALTARFVQGLVKRTEALLHGMFHVGDSTAEALRIIALPNVLSAIRHAVDPMQAAHLLHGSASLLRLSGRRSLMTRLCTDVLDRLAASGDTSSVERGCILMELGFSRMEEGRLDEGERILEQGRVIALNREHFPLHARFEMALARVAISRGAFDRAQAHLEQALASAGRTGLPGIVAGVRNTVGNLNIKRGRLAEALAGYHETLTLLPPSGFVRLRGMLHHNIAWIERNRRRLAAAEFYYRQAIALARRGDRLSTVHMSAGGLGQIAWSTGRPEAGKRAMAEAIRGLERVGNIEGAASYRLELGLANLLDGELATAQTLLRACLADARAPWMRLVALSFSAVCVGLDGRSAEAAARLDEADALSGASGGLNVIASIIRFGLGAAERPSVDAPWLALFVDPAWRAADLLRRTRLLRR